jgi:polyphosphate kinase 2 (PPK2 family)
LLRRLENEKHNWKFTPGDLEEREHWEQYTKHYEEAINNTSKPHASWYVIPADDKANARYLVAQTIYDVLKQYKDIKEPLVDEEVLQNISAYREKLKNEE